MLKKITVLVLCLMFLPISALAETPKVASIKEGQKSPFTGYLFNYEAYAAIDTDKKIIIEKCEAEKKFLVDKCQNDCKLVQDTCNNEKDALEKSFKIQLESKDNQINRLNEQLLSIKPVSRGLWFGVGAGIGIILGAGAVIAIARNI